MKFHYKFLLIFGILKFFEFTNAATRPANVPEPDFSTTSKTFRVATKDTVALPCEVVNKGNYVVLWQKGSMVLTAGSSRISPDDRIRLVDGYNLEIRDVETSDAGDYHCYIATLEPKKLKHTVEVLVPAIIRNVTLGGKVVVRKGASVTLECDATGNPVPKVFWSRRNNVLRNGDKSYEGSSYMISQVTRHDSGVYICTANNGVGIPATEQILVQVHYSPEVEVEKSWVHTGIGYETQLVCIVHADPPAEVLWYRDTLRLDTTERKIMESRGSRHTLIIHEVRSEDFGNYSCLADNTVGKSRKYLELSGKPHIGTFRSLPTSNSKDSYNVTWVVTSYTPLEEYRLYYRQVRNPESESRLPSSPVHFDQLRPDRRENEIRVISPKYNWRNISENIPFKSQLQQNFNLLLTKLEPSTQYEVIVETRNRFGWSEQSEAFRFSTRGTDSRINSQNNFQDPEMRDLGVKAAKSSKATGTFKLEMTVFILSIFLYPTFVVTEF